MVNGRLNNTPHPAYRIDWLPPKLESFTFYGLDYFASFDQVLPPSLTYCHSEKAILDIASFVGMTAFTPPQRLKMNLLFASVPKDTSLEALKMVFGKSFHVDTNNGTDAWLYYCQEPNG